MSGPACPHCGAQQDPGAAGLCWFCRRPLDASAGDVPEPPRPLPREDAEAVTTAAALAAGLASVAVGGLLYSTGFGALMTFVVVLPLSWVLLSMFLKPPGAPAQARTYTPARGPLKPAPREREPVGPALLLLRVLQVVGAVVFVTVATALTGLVALALVCAYALGNVH